MTRHRAGVLSAAAIMALAAVVTGCSSSSAHPSARELHGPLPSSAPGGPLLCGFVSADAAATATGRTDLVGSGDRRRYARSNGHRLISDAACLVDGTAGSQLLGVEVLGASWRSDLEQDTVDTVAHHDAPYLFPSSYGTGFAVTSPKGDVTKVATHVLYGDYYVTVELQRVAAGRSGLRDAVALTHQVISSLKLSPTISSPYPQPQS